MRQKALVVTHGSDVDGIVSAAILKKLLLGYDVEFIFVIYSIQENVFEKISHREDLTEMEVFIVDLSCNDYLVSGSEESIIQRIARRAKSVVYADHHIGTQEHKQLLEDLGVDVFESCEEKKCASRLIYELYSCFFPEKYFDSLSFVAQSSDYPDGLKDEISRIGEDLNKIISLYLSESNAEALGNLVITLSENGWHKAGKYSDDLEKALVLFQAKQKESLTILKESVELIEIADRKIMLGFGQGILPDKDTIAELMKQDNEKADSYIIAFGMPINGALALSSVKSNFPAVSFCKFMEGGGRPYGTDYEMGGFSFAFNVTEESYKKAKEIIIEGLKDFLKK
jgi:oligoribonuclease NrnB/cAMP/cGMP phosphodiesterase (DHH superfamily)